MRTISGAELTTLQGSRVGHFLKVEVTNGSGTYKDLTALGGVDWVDDVTMDHETVDAPIGTATIAVRRATTGVNSLSPLMAASPLNVNDAAAYAPLLDVGRTVRISVAVMAAGATPSGGDWKELFLGRIDRVRWNADPIQVECSDLGAWLMDTQIETQVEYGMDGDPGVPVQTIMQAILDAWPNGVLSVPTLYTPVNPGWNIRKIYKQDRVKVLEAIRALALQIGYECRYRYDAAHAFRLTFFAPDRAKTVADATITAAQYTDVTHLDIPLDNIRNYVKVTYRKTDGTVDSVVASDSASITHFGRRVFDIQEAGTSNIDTAVEAQLLADAVVSDLAQPVAEQDVRLLLFWPAQHGDLYSFTANGTHYDSDQKLAVVGVRHEWRNGAGYTTLKVRGGVSGAYADWLRMFGVNKVTPAVTSIVPSFAENGTLSVSVQCNGITGSFKVAVSTSAYPSAATVRATAATNGRSGDLVFAGPFASGATVYISAFAYSGTGGAGDESKKFDVQLGRDALVYNQCLATVTAVTATTVTVTVTGVAITGTPTVELVAVTGSATQLSGPAVGVPSASGTVWVFTRGAFQVGVGQAQFRAVFTGNQSDDDFVDIPEIGRDTVYLASRARVIASSATTVTVRYAVADPYPQGANTVTVAYQDLGSGGVTPASGGTLTPAATLTEAAGTFIDYTITRPAFAAGSGRVTFTATASNRVSDSDAVDVPALELHDLPIAEITIGNNQSTTDLTALVSALINADESINDIRWLASTSAFPSQSGTATTGAIVTRASAGVPFTISSLGVSLALGSTVYLSVQPRRSGGSYTSVNFIQIQATRSNINIQKTVRLPYSILQPADSTTYNIFQPGYYHWDQTYYAGSGLNGWRTATKHRGFISPPKGATLTAVRIRGRLAYVQAGDSLQLELYRVDQSGSRTQLGSTQTLTTDITWTTLAVSSLSEDTSGDRSYEVDAIGNWHDTLGGSQDFRVAWVEYEFTSPNTSVST